MKLLHGMVREPGEFSLRWGPGSGMLSSKTIKSGCFYPLVNIHKAIEHGHRNSGFSRSKWWFSGLTMWVWWIFHGWFFWIWSFLHFHRRIRNPDSEMTITYLVAHPT
jgi:hypothetical protein